VVFGVSLCSRGQNTQCSALQTWGEGREKVQATSHDWEEKRGKGTWDKEKKKERRGNMNIGGKRETKHEDWERSKVLGCDNSHLNWMGDNGQSRKSLWGPGLLMNLEQRNQSMNKKGRAMQNGGGKRGKRTKEKKQKKKKDGISRESISPLRVGHF